VSDIELSMRRLKRVPSDDGLTFTLETATEQKKDNLLCNFCGFRDSHNNLPKCSKHKVLKSHAKTGIGLLVRTCEIYQPVLTFRLKKSHLAGFDTAFNTFRLGSTWYNRLSVGTICALYDSIGKKMFGKAVVNETHHGDMEEMCYDHAYKNHLFLDDDQETASNRMIGAMQAAYGHIMEKRSDQTCTVVYLDRIKPT